jgi:hypothetical protein
MGAASIRLDRVGSGPQREAPSTDQDRQTGARRTAPGRDRWGAAVCGIAPGAGHPPRRALPAFLEPLLSDLERADAFELDRRLRRLRRLEQRLDAEIGLLLARIARGRGYREVGLPSMERFARERLGLSPRKARALLRLERACELCPELREAYRSGRLSWVQAQTLLPLVVLEEAWRFRRGWIAWAGRVSVRRLEEDVERALVLRETEPGGWHASGGLPQAEEPRRDEKRQTGVAATVLAETSRLVVVAPRDVTRLARATLCTVRRRLERRSGRFVSEGEGFEAMLEHAIEAWGGNERRVRAEHRVFERDGWRCTAPACSSRRNLHDHHIRFRSAGGSDALSNRTTLCAWHHLRGVHAGIVRCTGEAPGRLFFELGVRAGALPLARYRAGDVRCLVPSPGVEGPS